MQGTVPSADNQRAGPSPGTAWSRKHIITDVDSLASDSGKTHLLFKCKEKQNFSLQTEHFLVLLFKFRIQILDSKWQMCLIKKKLYLYFNNVLTESFPHCAALRLQPASARHVCTSTDPTSLVLSPFHSLLYAHMLSHAHTQSWTETGTQRPVHAVTHIHSEHTKELTHL